MNENSDTTTRLQSSLDRMNRGEPAACFELIGHAYRRLEKLARIRLHEFPRVGRQEETGSVLHDALMSLERSLEEVRPRTVLEFFGLASRHMRWVLLELSRDRRVATVNVPGLGGSWGDPVAEMTGPITSFERRELHEVVEGLPAEDREVVDLLFYQGLLQSEAAALLGVSERTVKRRWRAARLGLQRQLADDPGGTDDGRRDGGRPRVG